MMNNNFRKLSEPVVFVHIPKTAGTSFVNYLFANMKSSDDIAPCYFKDLSATGMTENKFKFYWGHFKYSLTKDVLKNPYYLTFLRDPLARTISQYKSWHNKAKLRDNWLAVMTPEEVATVHHVQNMTFEEYVFSGDENITAHIRDVQTRFLCDVPDDKDMLESAKKNLLEKFYYFGITERFDESIALLRRGFKNIKPYFLSAVMENRSDNKTIAISSEITQRIYELNKNDFELYHFANEVFNERAIQVKGWRRVVNYLLD